MTTIRHFGLSYIQSNSNSGWKIQLNGRKQRGHIKSFDSYVCFPLSNRITKLVNAEKTRKEILFIRLLYLMLLFPH